MSDLPPQGRDYVIAGLVGSSRRITTRDGRGFIAAEVTDLSGTLEVTVWPDVYERTTELWNTGSILLLQVRVRERGDRLTAGVIELSPYSEEFTPPDWLEDVTLEVPARGERGGRTNGAGTKPNGVPAAPAPVNEPPPIDDALLADMDAAFEVFPPAGVDAPLPGSPPPPPVITHPEPFRLTMEESLDEEADQKRLSAVFRLLQERPGADPVYLTIRTSEGDTYELQLPSATLDEGLRESLESVLATEVAVS
jgi:hypothetical protein